MLEVEKPKNQWSRHGLTKESWAALTPMERVIHYNRHLPGRCEQKANINDWPVDLRDSYSYDPYAHTKHNDE